MPVGIGAGTMIAGIAAGAGATAAGVIGSRSAHRAGDLSAAAASDALTVQKEQDAKDRAQYLEERQHLWANEAQDRALKFDDYYARQERLAPYRTLGADSVAALSRGMFQPSPVSMKVPAMVDRSSVAALAAPRG